MPSILMVQVVTIGIDGVAVSGFSHAVRCRAAVVTGW